jgi:hypothetical protein
MPEHLRARRSAQRRERRVQVLAGFIALTCLLGSGLLLNPINAIRKEHQLVIDPETVKGLPPDLALLGKLGTFRALAIDWASIRAERLKEEGKTYEALQLHETVCALAPRFPTVWQHAAWNMAYNISVMKYTPQERWQWVRNGIELLRDRGLHYNPKAVGLYKELSWIYWHKIGDFLDDEHLNYKRALAVEMERVLGPPIVALTDQEYFDWFRKIVEAPRDLAAFIETDADVARVVTRLRSAQLAPDDGLLEFVARQFRPELRVRELVREAAVADPLETKRLEVLNDPNDAAVLERLLAAVRSERLRNHYRFDLDWMLDLMVQQYGPLDWRNGFAHALYWSSWGDKVTRGREGASKADVVNTARFVFFSLQSLVTRGKIILWPNFDDPFASHIELTPDTRFIPYLYQTYLRLGKEHFGGHPDFREGTPGPNYMVGFVSNMQSWIELLYLEGGEANMRLAQNYYAWLRDNNPHPDGSVQEQYTRTVEEFVLGSLLDQMQTYKAAHAIVRGFLDRAFKELSLGLRQASTSNVSRARLCYDYWMADTRVDPNDRRKMPPFGVMVRDELESYFKAAEISALSKAALWKALPLEQRQSVNDRLRTYFEKVCAAQKPPWDDAKAFSEPPGMEAYRAAERAKAEAEGKSGVEQGEIPK